MVFIKNLGLGFFLIFIGIYTLIDVYKNPDSQLKGVTLGRYMSGTGCIILGVLIVFGIQQFFKN